MPSRENKDTATQREKRCMASLQVHLTFVNPEKFEVFEFDPVEAVLAKVENKVKYFGKVTQDRQGDECSCDSYWYGMGFEPLNPGVTESRDAMKKRFEVDGKKGESRYVAENGHPFDCKHIIHARFVRFGEKPE